MKKTLWLFIFIFTAAALLFGCSKVNIEAPEDDIEFPEPEIKDIYVRSSGMDLNAEIISDLIEAFTSDNPEFRLKLELGGTDSTAIAQAITSGTQPDLIHQYNVKQFYYGRLVQSMEPYIAQDPSFDRNDFHPLIYEFGQIGNELWALTTSTQLLALMYNKDMFEANGLDPESPPERWGEMIEMQKALTKRDARGLITQTGYRFDKVNSRLWCSMTLYDGTSFRDDHTGVNYYIDTENMYQVIIFFREIVSVYGYNEGLLAPSITGLGLVASLKAGLVAMIYEYGADAMIGNDFSIGIAPFPNSEAAAPDMYVNTHPRDVYMIVRDAPNPEGAWYYLMWYNKFGVVQAENFNYQKDPATYFPKFMTQSYTHARVGDMYFDGLSEEAKVNILKRDYMMFNNKLTYNLEPTDGFQRMGAFNGARDMIISTGSPDIRARLRQLQSDADNSRDKWYEAREREGWEFSDEFPWGIPPQDDDIL